LKYLDHLQVRDEDVLDSLSHNHLLSSYPQLHAHRAEILQAYDDYVAAAGAAPASHPMLPQKLVAAMKSHYSSPPKYSWIDGFTHFIRYRLSPGVCPTCGAESASSVDHVYPKTPWPVYSFFSLNLVPACDQCNHKKNDSFFGDHPGERPAHPYFDTFLRERVVMVKFTGAYPTPAIDIVPTSTVALEHLPIVNWQIENVLRKTQVRAMLTTRWVDACREPSVHYESLQYGATVEQAVRNKLNFFDRARQTPNNWESMLQAGILQDVGAQQYLERCLADPQANPR
jgi:hypothetical protein